MQIHGKRGSTEAGPFERFPVRIGNKWMLQCHRRRAVKFETDEKTEQIKHHKSTVCEGYEGCGK